MSNVRPVIDAGYACASGPKSAGDASPNPSPVIRWKFGKRTQTSLFFQVWFFFSSFALCFVMSKIV
jgi:hypothetical protein